MNLEGKKILITVGPTYEAIDPVRFIGNHSSGKMGFAITNELLNRGAEVVMVVGPTKEELEHKKLKKENIISAEEMLTTCNQYHSKVDIAIFCAAVADYRPKTQSKQKIKKAESELRIDLIKNPDIAFELGQKKKSNQFHIGFALETNNEEINAIGKLEKKKFDMIILNSLQDKGAGFQHNTNKISIIEKNKTRKFELKTKDKVAIDIVDAIAEKKI